MKTFIFRRRHAFGDWIRGYNDECDFVWSVAVDACASKLKAMRQ